MIPRERLEHVIVGQPTDRIPAVLWSRFPGDDQRAADFARAVVMCPSSTYQATDYGVLSAWEGSADGDRVVKRHAVGKSLDWTELRRLDPMQGETGKVIEAVRLAEAELGADSPPILLTIYSPLVQAARLAGDKLLHRNMRTHADRLRSGLSIITDNTLRMLEALRRVPVAGICYRVHHADYDHLSEAEYAVFGAPYDRKILSELPEKWWLNMVSIGGDAPMFGLMADYPVEVFQWNMGRAKPGIAQGKSQVRGAICGGLDAWAMRTTESPNVIKDTCRQVIREANGRRLILGADGPLPVGTPISNLRAIRESTQTISGGL